MSTQFNTTQNAPSRSNANRSPRKQPTAFPRNGKFPPNYGIASPNFGKESYPDLVKRLRG